MDASEIILVEKLGRSDLYWRAHKRARHIWARTSNVLLASIAVTGALTGGSAIADRTIAAVVLGVSAAVLSGTNAGLQPAERAAEHRTASAGYGRIFRSLEHVLSNRAFGQALAEELVVELATVDKEFDKLELEAPSVKPRRRERVASARRVAFVLTGESDGNLEAVDTW